MVQRSTNPGVAMGGARLFPWPGGMARRLRMSLA
jgi:hypothetical protein